MRNSIAALGLLTLSATFPAQASYLYGFSNVYTDYLTWTSGAGAYDGIDVSESRDDHIAIGIEAGAGFNWGEIYGFYEYEKLNKGSDDRSTAFKVTAHYKLFDNVSLYGHVYDLVDNRFGGEQNRVIGIGYLGLTGKDYWFKPWIGVHDVSREVETGVSGLNGGMLGWTAGWNVDLGGQKLLITNWNEFEFGRSDEYQIAVNTKSNGVNGGLSLWYDLSPRVYTGLTYRYYSNKLGVDGFGDALILRLGIHL